MKHAILLFLAQYLHRCALTGLMLVMVVSTVNAQVYRPFNANSVALYTTAPVAGATSSLAFTGAEWLEGDSVFYPVKRIDFYNEDAWVEIEDFCEDVSIWDSGCNLQNAPMWLGSEMRMTDPDIYEYETINNESLVFNFGTATGDTSTIYQNADQSLLLIAEGPGTVNHLDVEDAVYQYRLAHLNAQGEPLDTDLHEAPITLGAELGAIHFLRIDSFPEMAQPIMLAGHVGAEAGLYEITEADIYDYSVGDLFQYSYYSNESDPFNSTFYYETFTVMERVEDENEISYTFDVHRFTTDSTTNQLSEDELTVSKTAVMATFPIELQESQNPDLPNFSEGYHFQNILFTPDSCGSEYTYNIEASYLMNCPQDGINCYGNVLHAAPGEWHTVPSKAVYKQGLGKTYSKKGWNIVSGISGSTRKRLIYSEKNGSECGDQVVLNTADDEGNNSIFKVYPNPVSDVLNISFIQPIVSGRISLQVFDAVGRKQEVQILTENTEALLRINTEGWKPGIYIYRILEDNIPVGEGKFIVLR